MSVLVTGFNTNSVAVFDFSWDGRRIYLIDTPGFNDTNRSDVEILEILATYLGASYANGVRIHGLIVLHPISDNRMTGSSLRNIELIKAICGFTCYRNVAIATTMWPHAPDQADRAVLENRVAELVSDGRFFGDMVARGAALFRHNESGTRSASDQARSARHIVNHLVQQSKIRFPDVLQLQREMVDEGKVLSETAAGIAVAGELFQARRAHQRELEQLEVELNSQLAQANAAYAAQLQELQADVAARLMQAEDAKVALQKSMHEMHRDEDRAWRQRIKELDRRFRKQLAEKEQELLDMEESLMHIRWDMARHQGLYGKFKAQTGNIVNGGTNGLAAG
ncbi:hypothetical protein NEMBOFW57_007802 [Staphylotrichum longicolle]|uniref:G domain-containing protein n=1 Tax=Staphylotrichum longicolle TaxID=669026 RepID=A0AAD4HYU2_9PEZI|nr:hypothetical protein NEMBOFW57_007802 [Staphylotrichum longicolle]